MTRCGVCLAAWYLTTLAVAQYEGIVLHPVGVRYSGAYGVSGGEVVGQVGVVVGGFNVGHGVIYKPGNSFINLTPKGFASSRANATFHGIQGGDVNRSGGFNEAIIWRGTAEDYTILHPPGWGSSQVRAIWGNEQVGIVDEPPGLGRPHAALWRGTAASFVDLMPSGFTTSVAYGVYEGSQVGGAAGPNTGSAGHAFIWRGSRESALDVHPEPYDGSVLYGIHRNQQVGVVTKIPRMNQYLDYAAIWHDTAGTMSVLHPSGWYESFAVSTNGRNQVGYASRRAASPFEGRIYHAGIWSGTAESFTDLHSFLPHPPNSSAASYKRSWAYSIDEEGNIAGVAQTATGQYHAVMWRPLSGK